MSVPIPPQPQLTPEQWGQRFGAWQQQAAALATAKTSEVIERKALAGYYFPQLDSFDGGGQRISLGNGSDLRGEAVTHYALKANAFNALSDAGKATALQLIATLFTSEKSVKLHIVPTANEPAPYKLPERAALVAAAAAPAPGAPIPPPGFPAPPLPHAGATAPPPMPTPGMPTPAAAPMPTPGAQSATLPPQQAAKPARAPRKPRAAAAPAAASADPAPQVDAWITTAAANGASYAQLVGDGWTHELLLQHGLIQPNPAAAPPAPPAPPVPAAPAAPVFAMTASAGGYSREEMLAAGWTDENLITAGHMVQTNATAAAPPATRGRGRPRKAK